MAEEKEFTAEEIAAATATVLQVVRDLDKEVGGIEEECGVCGQVTGWDEAMYDLLAKQWICPRCWENAMGPLLSTSKAGQSTGRED
jgi:hypothetical protein